jgi:hypothetical protein
MVPSLLPAFSAPTGVRSAPSRAASAAVSFAAAGAATPSRAVATAQARILVMVIICGSPESGQIDVPVVVA